MAILRIYGVIAGNEESAMLSWCGVEHASFSEVSRFITELPEDDENIDILIDSRGGSVTDGWAIYDALRQSGRKITATVEGACASMASVVLMAAPKESRFSAPHASFCIHEPCFPAYSIDKDATATMLSQLSEELRIETQRFIDLYVERTGTDADTIARVMSEGRVMDAEEALSLGIVGVINTPNTASINQNTNNMKKNAIARLLEQARALLGGVVTELRLTTTSGAELVVETDADDPREGDPASPDGEHTLEDGRVVVVADGFITKIRERTEKTITEEEVQAMADTIESITAEVERLRQENSTLLETQRTAEETTIVEMVAKAGGIEWLTQVAVSSRTATQRTQSQSTQAQGLSRVERELAELRDKKMNKKQ